MLYLRPLYEQYFILKKNGHANVVMKCNPTVTMFEPNLGDCTVAITSDEINQFLLFTAEQC